MPTFGKGVVYDVDQKTRTEQFRFFTEALKKDRLAKYVPQFVAEAEVRHRTAAAAARMCDVEQSNCTAKTNVISHLTVHCTSILATRTWLHMQAYQNVAPPVEYDVPAMHRLPLDHLHMTACGCWHVCAVAAAGLLLQMGC